MMVAPASVGILLDLCRQGKPVHAGHRGIEQHQGKGCPREVRLCQHGQRCLATVDTGGLQTPVGQ